MNVPEEFQGSKALQYVISKGWSWKQTDKERIELESCPMCKKAGYAHFYMRCEASGSDGLWMCHKCGKSGHLNDLREEVGDKIVGVASFGGAETKGTVEDMPNIDKMHEDLLSDVDVMDYLVNGRGFSIGIIKERKLGVSKRYFRNIGEVKALAYPYMVGQNPVFIHWRSLPPAQKEFSSLKGWDAPLYNGEIIREGLQSITFVEGEANTIAALDHGIKDICGVPGANFKKAMWLEQFDQLGIEKVYICYDKDKVGQAAAQTLASRIGINKCYKIMLPNFDVPTDDGGSKKGKDINEWFIYGGGTRESFEALQALAAKFDVDGVTGIGDGIQSLVDEINGKQGMLPKYMMPWATTRAMIGFEDGDILDIIAAEKIGKLQPLDSKILTPTGWKLMGDLKVGDALASIDGEKNEVTHLFPQGEKEIFKITFSDGRSTEAGAEHLWKVADVNQHAPSWRIYTTDAIMAEYSRNQTGRGQKIGNLVQKLHVPLFAGDFGRTKLPLNPWLTGALIGDGGLSNKTPTFTSADPEIVERASAEVLKVNDELKYTGEKFGYRINGSNVREILKTLKLYGHTAESKFIPQIYLDADKESRWELLRGLLDTDGTASNKHGVISYCTISEQLAKDFVYLVRSLGGIAKVGKPQKKSFTYKGEHRTGQPAYIIVVRLSEREKAFSLKRKLDRIKTRKHEARLKFTHIESVGIKQAQCIGVSHPSRLYITDDFIVTHNSIFGMNMMEYFVNEYNEDGIIICLEMTNNQQMARWVSHVAQVEKKIELDMVKGEIAKQKFIEGCQFAKQKHEQREGNLYFCYPSSKISTVDDFEKLIVDIIRRYGVKFLMIDNVQLLSGRTIKGNDRTQHLDRISKMLQKINKDYGTVMLRIVQPHAIRKGNVTTSDDTDGSSQIRKDCDGTITLNRARKSEGSMESLKNQHMISNLDASFERKIRIGVELSRYSAGGECDLDMVGELATVREYSAAQIAAEEAQKKYAEVNENGAGQGQTAASNIQADIGGI